MGNRTTLKTAHNLCLLAPLFFFKKKNNLFPLFIYLPLFECVQVCQSTHMEVRGQFSELALSFHLVGPGNQLSLSGLLACRLSHIVPFAPLRQSAT